MELQDVELSNKNLERKHAPGEARVKAEYLLPICKNTSNSNERTLSSENGSEKTLSSESGNGKTLSSEENFENSETKIKQGDRKRDKRKGRNKDRPHSHKASRCDRLCPQLKDVLENDVTGCTFPNCSFIHDVADYVKSKPADLGTNCHNYDTLGRCPMGVTCRFGSSHITEEFKNKINKDKYDGAPKLLNNLTKDLQKQLWKKKYDFSKAENAVKANDRRKEIGEKEGNKGKKEEGTGKMGDELNQNNCSEINEQNEVKTAGAVEDEIGQTNMEKKKVNWDGQLYLAPLTTVGNLPFRRVCKRLGADITCGEMAMATNLLQGSNAEWALVKRHPVEDVFGVQICGNNPWTLTKCAQLLNESIEIDFLDINLGCPIDLVYEQGAGSAMMRRHNILETSCRSMCDVLDVPLTLKMRAGVYKDVNIAHKLIEKAKNWGVDMITVHGRSREQRYTKSADWQYVSECCRVAAPLPLYGNGDVLSWEDYSVRKEMGVAGVMFGRAALIKPWIFTEVKEQRTWDITSSERFDILKEFCNYGLEHWGSDTEGVEKTRRFLLEWLSFLHRYIPAGLLEILPQKINDRPPVYKGRNDLETLMASANCNDWIDLSEMLLGKVPDSFTFLPKHKANSWS